jgi:hypothetical protein
MQSPIDSVPTAVDLTKYHGSALKCPSATAQSRNSHQTRNENLSWHLHGNALANCGSIAYQMKVVGLICNHRKTYEVGYEYQCQYFDCYENFGVKCQRSGIH